MNTIRAVAVVAMLLWPQLASAQSPPAASDQGQTNRVKIEYVAPTNPDHQPLLNLLKRRHVLERIQTLLRPFRLPRDLLVRVMGCNGVMNAWYEQVAITVCYEYLDFVEKNTPKETSRVGNSRRCLGRPNILRVYARGGSRHVCLL